MSRANLTSRTTSESSLENDRIVRFALFLVTAAASYSLSLFTPAGAGPSAWIAAIFVVLVLPLILSVVLPETLQRNRLLALFLLTLIGNFAFILLLLSIAPRFSFGASSYLIPPSLAALVLTTLVGPRAGLLLIVLLGMGEFFLLRPDSRYLISSLITGLAAIYLSRKIARRSDLLRAGAGLGLVALFTTVIASGLNFNLARELLVTEALSAAALGLLGAILVGAILPILESAFDRTTDLSWLELTSLDHPILRRLSLEAPGTYLHSILVGHLAEAAAAATHSANPRACRAMALYHDIGKIGKAEYFTENFNPADPDPHANLTPTMSGLIILAHVKEGLALARHHRLPRRVREAIREHHGTSLVWYFYQRALQHEKDARTGGKILRLRDEDIPPVSESSFRYSGPVPQSPETALLSLADIVESASRSLEKPAPSDAAKLVERLFTERESEGHWKHSGLTQTEWQSARRSLATALQSILRPRIRYPKDRRGHKNHPHPLEQSSAPLPSQPHVSPS
ncbi:MAG: HDIG domain-containing protein [Verrucomicrobia bacterium]|nr:HDIG domain-containing protein [Verrucomicrobiota bacterium]